MSPWGILGLAPGATTVEIRRAYAVLLKRTRPEDDPAGFQRLRAAYETALALNQREAVAAAPQTAEPPPIPPEPLVSPQPIPLDEIARDTIQIILDALGRGDGHGAAILLAAAIDKNRLPIAAEIGLAERLVQVLLADRTIPPERLRDIAVQFNWYGAADALRGRNGQAERALCARIDAELWLGGLRAQAKDWRFWCGDQGAGAARLLLGRGPMLLSWFLPPEPPLSVMAAQLARHYGWIAPHFSERRLRDVERLTTRMRKRRVWQPRILAGLLVALVGVAMLVKVDVTAMIVILPLVFFARAPHAVRSVFVASMALFGLLWVNAMTGWISPNLSAPRWVDYTQPGTIRPPLSGGAPASSPGAPPKAFDIIIDLRKRAEAGDPDAIDRLAFAYLYGESVEQNYAEALRWLRIGVEHSHPIAERTLGLLYEDGLVVPRDYVQARQLFVSCLSRDFRCNTALAYLYYKGLGTSQDFKEAYRYYAIAAKQGDPWAQQSIAIMLREGQGIARDPAQSYKWMKAAAIRKLPDAMNDVGWYYHIGMGVKPDAAKAQAWLTAAADAGLPAAMVNLVSLKNEPDRTKADQIEAYRWLSLALRTKGFVPDLANVGRALARASKRLTLDQRAKLDAEIAAWKPQMPSSLPETDGDIPN